MVGQILPNNNEKCYSNFSPQLFHLDTPLLEVNQNAKPSLFLCSAFNLFCRRTTSVCKLPDPNLVPIDESSSDEHCIADGAKSPFQLTTSSTIMYHNANSSTKRCSCCAVTSNSRGWFGFHTSLFKVFINMPLTKIPRTNRIGVVIKSSSEMINKFTTQSDAEIAISY
jgi:hypothetical protein